MELSSSNKAYLDRIKNDIISRNNWETIRSNALTQLDRRLKAGTLNQSQYDFLKTEISWAKKIESTPTITSVPSPAPVWSTTVNNAPVDSTKEYIPVSTVKDNNPNTPAFEATWDQMEKNADKYSSDIEKSANERAAQEQALILQRDADKRARADQQEKDLTTIEDKAEANLDERRKDADALYKTQNEIASRNANMAAAQAGQTGLQLSQAELESIRNDTIAKYGTNILNAQDFKNKTNMSIDEAITKLNLDVFQKQAEIDNFRNLLDNEEYAPMLNAVKAAAEWDKKAIDDVYAFYTEYTKKQAEETYNRMAKTDRYIAEENEFQKSDLPIKEKILYDKINEIPGFQYVAQDIGAILNQYPNASMTFLLSTIVEKAMKNQDSRNLILAAVQTGKLELPSDLKSTVLSQDTKEVKASDTTVQQNINNEAVASQNNPGSKTVTSNSTPSYSLSQANIDYINTIKDNAAKKTTQAQRDLVIKNAMTLVWNQLKQWRLTQAQHDAIVKQLQS